MKRRGPQKTATHDVNDIVRFVRVIEHGGVTAAARALGVQKSSLSRSVARLERDLGVRLMQRTTRQRGMTDAGIALYEPAREAVTTLARVAEAVAAHRTEATGIVRVAVPAFAAYAGVPQGLAALRDRHPAIRVDVVVTQRQVDLVAESFDLAIRFGALPDSTLVARSAGQSAIGLYASPAYLARHGTPRSQDELDEHDRILTSALQRRPTWQDHSGGTMRAFAGSEGLTSDDVAFAAAAAAAGSGIVALPVFVARSWGLVRVLPDHELGRVTANVVLPSSKLLARRVAVVRDALVAAVSEALGPTDAQPIAPEGGRS